MTVRSAVARRSVTEVVTMPTAEHDAAEKSYASKGLDREMIVRAALDSIDRKGSQG